MRKNKLTKNLTGNLTKSLSKNLSLKIMSVIVGILVWLIVVNVDNPVAQRTLTIQGDNVELLNTAYVDSANKMCIQDDEPDPIRVTITGTRKLLSKMGVSDVTLTADLQQAGDLNTDPVMVPITASVSGTSASDVEVSPKYLSVHLEDKATQEFLVNVNYGDTKPGKGYEVGTQTASPEKVKITGPKSLINKIDTVSVTVGVDGKTQDFTEETSLIIRDKNQDTLTGRMSYLTIDNSKVTVTTDLWKVQAGVKIQADYSGTPAQGYQVEKVSNVPESVSVAGTEDALAQLKSSGNVLRINGEEVNIDGKSEDTEIKVSLKDVLPENAKLTTGTSEDVIVKVSILPEGSHEYTLSTGEVKPRNLDDMLQIAFGTDTIAVRVKAKDGDLDSFSIDNVRAYMDLKDVSEGTYKLPVTVVLPKGYELLEEVMADVTISKISNTEEKAD